jgi:hypothetical protein
MPAQLQTFFAIATKMKTPMCIVTLILVAACGDRQGHTNFPQAGHNDTVVKHDTAFYENHDWQQSFNLTHDPELDSIGGQPVKFYIGNPNCSPIAIDFYLGQFRPTDNHTTAALLSLATTDDNQLRAFYRWCLSKTIDIQDGALAEYTGVPARQYAEKFPKEFFAYMDQDTTGHRYADWVEAISYSGYYDKENYKNPQDIGERLSRVMKENCKKCSAQLEQRIHKFAADCFP